jgi:hypothetical protein
MAEIDIQGYKVQVDDEDVEHIRQHKWHLHRSKRHLDLGIYYFLSSACKSTGMPDMRLHRFIVNAPTDMVVDHIDRNTLNCHKSNLRLVTQQKNIFNRGHQSNNSSGNRGVYQNKAGQWCVSFVINGTRPNYCFDSKESAQCVAQWIIHNLLLDREVNSIYDTYGEFPSEYSEKAMNDLYVFRTKTLRGIRKDSSMEFRGVIPQAYGKYMAQLQVNKKRVIIGRYTTPESAAIAYDKKALELLGENKARLNFPDRIAEYKKEAENGTTFV